VRQSQKTEQSGCRRIDRVEPEGDGGACRAFRGGGGNQGGVSYLMEAILDRENLNNAYLQVVRNKGAAGVDGMTYDQLLPYLKENGKALASELLEGKYTPKPVRRVEMPKPDGGTRKLGVPTVIDRMIQQAINQVLQPIFEPVFSDNSYGFRPGRSAHQAIERARSYYEEGYKYVVDIDMKAYFDTINHDKLMYLLEKRVKDRRVLRLIRLYLKSGIMEKGLFVPSSEGSPQGGNLSPLLSNVYLHEFDRLLESRGHKFVRYADDCNTYVKSRRAGARVMEGAVKFLEGEMKLTVNREKSAVGSPVKRKFLGFCIHPMRNGVKLRPHQKAKKTLKAKLKQLTKRNRGSSMEVILKEIRQLMTGWLNYYGISEMKSFIEEINGWLKRRIRQIIWKRWKLPRTRRRELTALGIEKRKAYEWSNTRRGYWRISKSFILHRTLTDMELEKRGYINIASQYKRIHSSY